MKPKTRGRVPQKVLERQFAAANAFLASASPKPLSEDAAAMATYSNKATTRGVDIDSVHANPKYKASSVPHESTVQAEIIEYLKSRPDIGCIIRLNSGTMSEGGRFVRMNTIYEPFEWLHDEKIYPHMADLQAMQIPSARLIAIEVKRPGWKQPTDKREHGQALYLKYVRSCGGIGAFVTCVADVERVLL